MGKGSGQALSSVVLERQLLAWMTGITVIGCALWLAALSTHFWLVRVPTNQTQIGMDNQTSMVSSLFETSMASSPREMTDSGHVIWSYSGIWEMCQVKQYKELARVECRNHLLSEEDVDMLEQVKMELILASVAVLMMVLGAGFSSYSLLHPKYVYKRLAATLHSITAVTMLVTISLADNSSHYSTHGWRSPSSSSSPLPGLHYGFSYLLAWCACLTYMVAAFTFLVSSRKRKLLKHVEMNMFELLVKRLSNN